MHSVEARITMHVYSALSACTQYTNVSVQYISRNIVLYSMCCKEFLSVRPTEYMKSKTVCLQ